ncbi:MAG: hypothetical protein IJ719_10820 [Clostridia bacterium]|nr:hypothetical protein [Clostridia bacterium]
MHDGFITEQVFDKIAWRINHTNVPTEEKGVNRKAAVGLILAGVICLMAWMMIKSVRNEIVLLEPVLGEISSGNRIECDLTLDDALRHFTGNMKVIWINFYEEDLNQIVFSVYGNEADPGAVRIVSATVNGMPQFPHFDEDATVLRFATPFRQGESLVIEMQIEGSLNLTENEGQMMAILPVPEVHSEGAWKKGVGSGIVEPLVAEAFESRVSICVPAGIGVLAGGQLTEFQPLAEGTRFTFEQAIARDLSIYAQKGTMVQSRADRVMVLTEKRARANELLRAYAEAKKRMQLAGFEPVDGLSIGECSERGGLALSGLILCENVKGENLVRQMIQLLSRQVFGVQVGNDMERTPWLSYTLAAYVELDSTRGQMTEAQFEARHREEIEISTRLTRPRGVCIGAEASMFYDRTELLQVLCEAGGEMMLGLDEAVGREMMCRVLSVYVEEYSGRLAGKEDFLKVLNRETGSEWRGYIEDWLAM